MDQPTKCFVVVASPKPKVHRGKYFPGDHCGTYGNRNKNSFAIPCGKNPVNPIIPNSHKDKMHSPFFVVDPVTGLAQPVGKTMLKIVQEWSQKNREGIETADLQTALEVATQKCYVKSMTLKVRDMVEMFIIGGAGAGIALYTLHLVGAITGHPITL